MKQYIALLTGVLLLAGCKSTSTLLPNVSGRAGEVVVVMDREDWEGSLGNEARATLAGDCPYLVMQEPMFSLVNVSHGGFSDMFKIHRNIVLFDINPQMDTTGVFYRFNTWARPQVVVQVSAYDSEGALALLKENSRNIVEAVEQAERDRVVANSRLYEETSVRETVSGYFPGSLVFPVGYKLRKAGPDFIWVANDRQYVYQDVFIYRYPVTESEPFTAENIIRHRNEILRENVPGMFENTYMTTSDYFLPQMESLRYRGRALMQTRGMWEVKNDYMGGPFVSHSFYSPDGKEIIVAEAWVYAPRYNKRQYLRQVEALLYSWQWNSEGEAADAEEKE